MAAIFLTGCLLCNLVGCGTADYENIRLEDNYYQYINKDALMEYDASGIVGEDAYDLENMQKIVDREVYALIKDVVKCDVEYEPGSNEQLVREAYQQAEKFLQTGRCEQNEEFAKVKNEILQAHSLTELTRIMEFLYNEKQINCFLSYPCSCYEDGNDDAGVSLPFGDVESGVGGFLFRGISDWEKDRERFRNYVNALAMSLDEEGSVLHADKFCNTIEEYSELYGKQYEENWQTFQSENGIYDELKYFSQQLYRYFNEEHLDIIKMFILCDVMYAWSDYLYLEYPFLAEYKKVQDVNSEDMAVAITMLNVSEPVSELYESQYYTEEMDAMIKRVYEDVRNSYKQLVESSSWLSESGKKYILERLDRLTLETNGQGKMIPDLELAEERDRMISYQVNAHYSRKNHSILISTAIMHYPYFDEHADYEKMLGTLGFFVAHEMGHSLATEFLYGFFLDTKGVSMKDEQVFEQIRDDLEEYYSGYKIFDQYAVDGRMTLEENYADILAFECLLNLVKEPEKQKVMMESYCNLMVKRMSEEDKIEKTIKDVHSPGEIRVNAVLSSMDSFYELYDIKPEDGMYVEKEKRIHIF